MSCLKILQKDVRKEINVLAISSAFQSANDKDLNVQSNRDEGNASKVQTIRDDCGSQDGHIEENDRGSRERHNKENIEMVSSGSKSKGSRTGICQGIKLNGEPCTSRAKKGTDFCRHHQDQANREHSAD